MEESIQNLPPSKRFKLLNHQQQTHGLNPATCLPAKKRIWAPHPLSPIKLQENPNPETPLKEKNQEAEKEEEEEEEDDDGVACAVCGGTDGDSLDPIVFCDGCDLMVHVSCYGNPLIKSIPDGDWFCLHCSTEPKQNPVSCCLCPKTGGALKPTTDNKWAHIICALFVPEVFFKDSNGRYGIDCSKVPLERKNLKCYLCGRRSGCGIDCSEPRCKLAFHVSCGVAEGLSVEYKEGKSGSGIVAGFCKEHTELWKKQQLTGKFKIVARDNSSKRKTRD